MTKKKVENRIKFYRERFLEKYRRYHGHVSRACRATGISRDTFYRWLSASQEFANLFENARKEVVDQLEAEAYRRGVTGVLKPVFYKGQPIAQIREYSDQLLITLLKGNAPEKYRERTELTGPGGGPLEIKEVEVRLHGDGDRG